MTYRDSYPKRPIGGGNPYYCCRDCEIADPEINGELENHASWCMWRKREETVIDLTKLINAYIDNNETSENIARDIVNEYGLEIN